MKYYFITYQATSRNGGSVSIWNCVIDESPMKFIKDIEETEENLGSVYCNFVMLNTLEISKDEYNEWNGHF
jgi:hypothetical protein